MHTMAKFQYVSSIYIYIQYNIYNIYILLLLKVGQAAIIETEDPQNVIPYLICAPTMRVPEIVSGTSNAYLAFRASLIQGTTSDNPILSNVIVRERKRERRPSKENGVVWFLLSVLEHNKAVLQNEKQGTLIKSILCPGLGSYLYIYRYIPSFISFQTQPKRHCISIPKLSCWVGAEHRPLSIT